MPFSIKFNDSERNWLQAQANKLTNGRVGTLVKQILAKAREESSDKKRAKPSNK